MIADRFLPEIPAGCEVMRSVFMFMQYGSPPIEVAYGSSLTKITVFQKADSHWRTFLPAQFPRHVKIPRAFPDLCHLGFWKKSAIRAFLQKNQIIILLNKEFTITSQ